MDKTKPSPTFQKAVSRHNKEQKTLEISISWFIYSGYGKYSDPLKFFTLCYIAAIC